MIICMILKMHCKRLLQNAGFTWRLYSAHAARPQRSRRPHSVSTARCLTRCAYAKPRVRTVDDENDAG